MHYRTGVKTGEEMSRTEVSKFRCLFLMPRVNTFLTLKILLPDQFKEAFLTFL